MLGPRRSLGDYVDDRIQQFQNLGGVVEGVLVNEVGEWSILHAEIQFGDGGVLSIYELVELDEHLRPHRRKYSYHCQHRDEMLFRYDRDPVQHPEMPEHKHVPPDDRRVMAGRVTLQDVVDELWPIIAVRDTEAST